MKDKKEIAEIVMAVLKASDNTEQKQEKTSSVKISSKPKKLIPSSQKGEILKGLTIKERNTLWGKLDKDNIFGKKYASAHKLYKDKNIDGRPNVTYLEAWREFILPIAKGKKQTDKQLKNLQTSAIKQLQNKIKENEQKQPRFWDKRNEWIQKGIEGIKSPSPK